SDGIAGIARQDRFQRDRGDAEPEQAAVVAADAVDLQGSVIVQRERSVGYELEQPRLQARQAVVQPDDFAPQPELAGGQLHDLPQRVDAGAAQVVAVTDGGAVLQRDDKGACHVSYIYRCETAVGAGEGKQVR